jgi:uncharacterized damage-inducible protein DinB
MDLASSLRIQAHANRLANRRLLGAIAELADAEFLAPRIGFFPSLALTLNHILAVDEYYIGALHGDSGLEAKYAAFKPARSVAEFVARQTASDQRLIDWCMRLDAQDCDAIIHMDRGTHVQRERSGHVLAHLFMHQTHHRGQVHGMLCGTPVKPPQLDEFLMPSEAKFRVADMAALGWEEVAVYGSLGGRG